MTFSNVSDNNYYLLRPGFNPSTHCRATYTIPPPSTSNFYTTMSVGRALLLNPVILDNKNGTISVSLCHSILIFITNMLCQGMLYEIIILRVAVSTNKQLTWRYMLKWLKSSQKTFYNIKSPLRNSTSYTAYSSNNVMLWHWMWSQYKISNVISLRPPFVAPQLVQ